MHDGYYYISRNKTHIDSNSLEAIRAPVVVLVLTVGEEQGPVPPPVDGVDPLVVPQEAEVADEGDVVPLSDQVRHRQRSDLHTRSAC